MTGLDAAVLVFMFAFGWFTYGFVHGATCFDCWIALVNGRKYEKGCKTCCLWLMNERIKETDD